MTKLDPKSKWLFALSAFFILTPIVAVAFSGFLTSLAQNITTDEKVVPVGFAEMSNYFSIVMIAVVLIAIVISILYGTLSYKYYGYEVREDGFRKERGIISKKYTSIPYARIQNVDIYRNIFARIIGLSELRIQTAGDSMGTKFSEGILPGLDKVVAEKLRDELIKKSATSKNSGV